MTHGDVTWRSVTTSSRVVTSAFEMQSVRSARETRAARGGSGGADGWRRPPPPPPPPLGAPFAVARAPFAAVAPLWAACVLLVRVLLSLMESVRRSAGYQWPRSRALSVPPLSQCASSLVAVVV